LLTWAVHLQLSPVNYAPPPKKKFSALGAREPNAPQATPMAQVYRLQ